LFADLEQVFSFLVQKLPPDLVETISSTLLPGTMHSIASVWLDSAVPSSLQDMDRFQDVITATREFCARLKALGFSNLGGLREWTESAPRVWLSKCREAALDSVRTKLSGGLGAPKRVEKVEKQMVSRSEGQQLVANGAVASIDDHGWDAWDDGDQGAAGDTAGSSTDKPAEGGDDDGTDAWGWGEEEAPGGEPKESKPDDDEDPSAAWGWGDEANNDEVKAPERPQATAQPEPQTRELILRESYSISSVPQPVLDLISALLEDGATLTQEHFTESPVATQATGLFSLPTLVLAMFRAVSPHYYAPEIGGNM
jgi:centromere/kinetochore protein ZW10